jgi:hypothetical protein
MNKTHPGLWGFGLAGLASGIALVAVGSFGASELADMAGSYGVMVIAAASYLLAGLALRERFGRRSQAIAKV